MQVKLPLFPRTQITHPPEYKGKPKRYPIVYPPQPLMKASFKQLKQMFPNTNEHDHVLKWAADNIKHNDLQSLYLRHYKQNPQVHTEENKNKLGHINGMMDISPEIKNVKIDKKDTLESAFKKYDDAEHTWRQGNGARYVEPQGKPVVDFGDGWGWFDLGRSTCKKEGAAMGHCGNTGDPHNDDRILSLRKIVKVGDKTFHEPALTFINNHGWLGEMKGRANSKPSESYHKRIVELLKHPDIKGMVGAGYMPENNFHFDDLSPEHKNQVRMSNPNLVDLRSDDWDEKQKIFASDSVPKIEKYQHTVKDIFKGKRLKEDLDSGKINIDDLGASDLRLLTNHRLFQRQHLLKLIDEDFNNVGNARSRAQAMMAAKNCKHLDDDAINYWINHSSFTAAQVLGNSNKLNLSHIDKIIEKDPYAAAEHLQNHKDFNENHIDKIMNKDLFAAAQHLKEHKLFNQSHIDRIFKESLDAGLQYLADKMTRKHIDFVVQKYPTAAAHYLKDHLTSKDIDTIAENDPTNAAMQLHNHPLLNEQHIDIIAQKSPRSAEFYLKNHPYYRAKYGNKVQKSLQKTQQLEKVLVSSEPSEGVLKIAKYDGMRPNETHVSTTRVPHERFGSVYVHHFASNENTNARHLVSMHHDPHQNGVSVLLAARQNEDEPMTVYSAATHPNFQGNRLNYVALREAVKSHGTLHSDVMQSMPAFKNWNRLKQEAGFKVNMTKPFRDASTDNASLMPHIAQYSKQAERLNDMKKAISPEQQKENIKKSTPYHQQKVTFPLKGLHAEAAKYDNFQNFKKAFLIEIKHGTYWHVTENPNFQIDPQKGPKDMSSLAGNSTPNIGKLMVTSHLEHWADFYGKDRPYVAEIDMSEVSPHDYKQVNRGFGNEFFVKNPEKAKVIKTVPVAQAIKETKKRQKLVPSNEEELRQLYNNVHSAIKGMSGQSMKKAISPEQQKENIKKQRQLKNKEIIAKLKTKTVDKAPSKEPAVPPKLLIPHYDTPEGIPVYIKSHPSHDSLVGVHVHVDELPEVEHYKFLDEPKIDNALSSAGAKGFPAVYVSTSKKTPKIEVAAHPPEILDDVDPKILESMKNRLKKPSHLKLVKALWPSAPKVTNGQYAKPFSMGGTKKEKKTIYSHFSHPEHAKFNAQEHLDAYWRHQEKIKQNPKMEPSLVNFHKQQAQQHWDKSKNLVDAHDTSRRIEANKPK